jgi:MFS family permease
MITTMRGSLTEAIPMTDAQFGLLTSAFLWVYGLLSPFAGFIADRFNRSRVIVGSMFVWSIVTWLTAHATTLEQLLVMRALMGVSEAAYIPAALALIADYHRGPTRSLATGVHMSGIAVGSGLGGIGGWLAERHSWSYAFNLFGLAGIVYAGVLILTLRDAPREIDGTAAEGETLPKVRFGEALGSLFSRGSFIIALAYWSLLGFVGWAVVGWTPSYLSDHFHLSQGIAGLSATGYLQAAALVGLLVGGAWADRWSRTHARGRIFVTVIGLSVAAPGILLMAHTNILIFALLGLMLYGLARAFADANMMPILCTVADPRYRATGYGILNSLSVIIGGLAIYAGGAMRDAHLELGVIFQIASASMVCCAVLLLFVRARPHQNPVQ